MSNVEALFPIEACYPAYSLTDEDKHLIAKVRSEIDDFNEGHPVGGVISVDEMIDALCLLVNIVDAGGAE